MRGYFEISFLDQENGNYMIFCNEFHIGFIMWNDKLNEYYFECRTECELYLGHMDVISAKLIELNGEKV